VVGGSAALAEGPPAGKGNRPPVETTNNLSFPALAVDGYTIATKPDSFTVPYTGDYPGLTADEIAALAGYDWYPQKTTGNTWTADYLNGQMVDVTYIDWGDNIESNNPKVRRPFRLEVQLYKQLNPWPDPGVWDGSNGMTGYTMAVLEYPSSSNELQGTNKMTYEGNFATVVSNLWKLKIQYCGDAIPTGLYWDGGAWVGGATSCTDVPVSFAVELNVGGKLIFGASEGGWKPANLGWYRITFYGPADTDLNLRLAEVGNYTDFAAEPADVNVDEPAPSAVEPAADEGGAATPMVDADNNLSYVDVQVVSGGGGGGRR
jgi:hypothetical protein